MKKKGGRVNLWGDRYFVLKGSSLQYYLKANDTETKGVLTLTSACKVTEIKSEISSKKKKQFSFCIVWPENADELDDGVKGDMIISNNENQANATPKKRTMYNWLFNASNQTNPSNNVSTGLDKVKSVMLAVDTFHEAEVWIQSIEDQIACLQSNENVSNNLSTQRNIPPPHVRLDDIESWLKSSQWRVYSVLNGVRIFELLSTIGNHNDTNYASSLSSSVSLDPSLLPCLRVNIGISAGVSDVFTAVMAMPPSVRTGSIKSFRIVEVIDSFTDIIYMALEPVFVHISMTAPRDLCLIRYWQQHSDGSCVVCLDSTVHADCPLTTDHVRAHMHAAYTITPPKEGEGGEEECLLTCVCQLDPHGWVPSMAQLKARQAISAQFLLHALDIRDAIDVDRFVQVRFDAGGQDAAPLPQEVGATPQEPEGSVATVPPPLAPEMWGPIDASSFRLRSKTYKTDGVKIPATTPTVFTLLCVDLLETPDALQNIAAHPKNRVFLAQQRGDKAWVFLINIMVPGPPFLSYVMYFQGDPTAFDSNTPFARIAKKFFTGHDDEYRNNRFKLIPKVVVGNMIIKMAVKDTPTLLGNKLKQYYHTGENYFEIDVDVGSSSIARNVVGIAIGYAKVIVVDIALCLQGDEDEELPEVLMGGVSCVHIDMTKAKKL